MITTRRKKPLERSTKPLKRTPIKRSTKPMARNSVVRKKRTTARRVSVVRDQSYMDWLKTQRCWVCSDSRRSDPAHTAKTNGARSKGPDSSCIPLCRYHHDEMDGRLNTKTVTKEQFAAKYGLDLAALAAEHYARYKGEKAC